MYCTESTMTNISLRRLSPGGRNVAVTYLPTMKEWKKVKTRKLCYCKD